MNWTLIIISIILVVGFYRTFKSWKKLNLEDLYYLLALKEEEEKVSFVQKKGFTRSNPYDGAKIENLKFNKGSDQIEFTPSNKKIIEKNELQEMARPIVGQNLRKYKLVKIPYLKYHTSKKQINRVMEDCLKNGYKPIEQNPNNNILDELEIYHNDFEYYKKDNYCILLETRKHNNLNSAFTLFKN